MQDLREQFQATGILRVPDAVPPGDLEALRAAAARLIARCRSGEHPWVRYSANRTDVWGVGKMFLPTSFEPALIEAMCGDRVREVTEAILGPSRLAIVSFLFNPERESWDGPWHRDSQYMLPQEPERQREVVAAPTWSVQWNTALYEDAALEAVPGSLGRWNTPAEQAVLDGRPGEMPGAVPLRLVPGEGVAYSPLLIHRGRYRPQPPRATLHFAWERREETDSRLPVHWPDVPPEALAALSPRARAALGTG